MASIWLSFLLATCGVLFITVDADQEKKWAQATKEIAVCIEPYRLKLKLGFIPPYQMSAEINLGYGEFAPECAHPCSVTVLSADLDIAPTIVFKGHYPTLKADIYRNCVQDCTHAADVEVQWICSKY